MNANCDSANSDPPWLSARQRQATIERTRHPAPLTPELFGADIESAQTGSLLLQSRRLPKEGRELKFIGRVNAELDMEQGREAACLAAPDVFAVARKHLGGPGQSDALPVRRVVAIRPFSCYTDFPHHDVSAVCA
jgi:hypothetical protein